MKETTDPRFTRKLTATAVSALLALSLGTGYAATQTPAQPQEQAQPQTPSNEQSQPETQAQDKEQLTERETISQYDGWDDPDMSRIAVQDGRSLLRHLQAAHAALEQGNTGEARSALYAAEDFGKSLQMMAPYTVVVDNVRNAEHKIESASTGFIVDELLPVYSNLEEMAQFAPEIATKAKAKLDEASKQIPSSDKTQSVEKLDEVAAEFSTTTVYLPVIYTQHQLAVADQALNGYPAHPEAAKTAIDDALSGMVQATVGMHLFPEGQAATQNAPDASQQAKVKNAG